MYVTAIVGTCFLIGTAVCSVFLAALVITPLVLLLIIPTFMFWIASVFAAAVYKYIWHNQQYRKSINQNRNARWRLYASTLETDVRKVDDSESGESSPAGSESSPKSDSPDESSPKSESDESGPKSELDESSPKSESDESGPKSESPGPSPGPTPELEPPEPELEPTPKSPEPEPKPERLQLQPLEPLQSPER